MINVGDLTEIIPRPDGATADFRDPYVRFDNDT
jgi:hypothetical protein